MLVFKRLVYKSEYDQTYILYCRGMKIRICNSELPSKENLKKILDIIDMYAEIKNKLYKYELRQKRKEKIKNLFKSIFGLNKQKIKANQLF